METVAEEDSNRSLVLEGQVQGLLREAEEEVLEVKVRAIEEEVLLEEEVWRHVEEAEA